MSVRTDCVTSLRCSITDFCLLPASMIGTPDAVAPVFSSLAAISSKRRSASEICCDSLVTPDGAPGHGTGLHGTMCSGGATGIAGAGWGWSGGRTPLVLLVLDSALLSVLHPGGGGDDPEAVEVCVRLGVEAS